MQLAVVIVSYNVQPYLLRCLAALRPALQGLDAEVWVVDNASSDGSLDALQAQHPDVLVIANNENKGFAQACNQAIARTQADYILLLNPDAEVAPDAVQLLLQYLQTQPQAAAVGPRLVDAEGQYMPESKRLLPTLQGSFGKLFLHSRHSGYYDTSDTHQSGHTQVLSGACMLLRTQALQQVGGLDAGYFLYGEDIALCQRLLQLGWQCHYCAQAQVLHHKGRSSSQTPLGSTWHFYHAMWRYYNLQLASGHGPGLRLVVAAGIVLRALLAGLVRSPRALLRLLLPILLLTCQLAVLGQAPPAVKEKIIERKTTQNRANTFDVPNRLIYGASFGTGGLHLVAKPSIDLHYGSFSLRLAPGLFYLSAGLNWRTPLYIKMRDCNEWPFYLGVYYHYSYFLAQQVVIRNPAIARRQQLMGMAGWHIYLHRRKLAYLDLGAGASYQWDSEMQDDGGRITRSRWLPTGEVRLGFIIENLPWPLGKKR